MVNNAVEKAAGEKLREILSQKMGKEMKWVTCSGCKTEIVDKEGHEKLIHIRDYKSFSRLGVRCFVHCPLCMPSPKMFAGKLPLLQHVIDVHSGDAQV